MSSLWIQFVPMDDGPLAIPDHEAGVLYVRADASEDEIGQAVLDHLERVCPRQRTSDDPSE